jgi:hypothetical protein
MKALILYVVENRFLGRLPCGSPGDDPLATPMVIPIAIFALEVAWLG